MTNASTRSAMRCWELRQNEDEHVIIYESGKTHRGMRSATDRIDVQKNRGLAMNGLERMSARGEFGGRSVPCRDGDSIERRREVGEGIRLPVTRRKT